MGVKRTLYMETTNKDPEITVGEIQKLLSQYGVKDIWINYEDGNIVALSFTIEENGTRIGYKLPARYEPYCQIVDNNEAKYMKTYEQARRVLWRQIYRWLEAQLALVQDGIAPLSEIFLPYMIVKSDKTLYEHFVESNKMLPGEVIDTEGRG